MLKRKYDAEADIPEEAKSFYVEKDGAWVLQLEDMKTEDDVARLKKALEAEREAHKESKSLFKKLEEKIEALGQKKDNPKQKDDTKGKSLELLALEQKQKEYDERMAVLEKEREALLAEKKNNAITKALREVAKGKITESAFADLELYASQFDTTENGEVVEKGSGKGVAEWFGETIKSRPHWLASNTPSGASGGNPPNKTLSQNEVKLQKLLEKDELTAREALEAQELNEAIKQEAQQQ